MIAKNYLKHPQAMALQMPLRFGRALIWHTSRPTTRQGRTFRATVSKAFKLAGRIKHIEPKVTPQWVRDAKRAAKKLAKLVQRAQRPLVAPKEPTNSYTQMLAWMREQLDRYAF